MIRKEELEEITHQKFIWAIGNQLIYQYAKYDIALNNLLLERTIRFADPTTFNDPFDCNERLLQIEYNEEQIEHVISNFSIANLTRARKRELKRRLHKHSYQNDLIKPLKKDYKISCFSTEFDEMLMWSHYADKHQGICVGFKFPHNYKNEFIISPVTYINEIKSLDGICSVQRMLLYWLTTKSNRWEYENEIRAIRKAKTKDDYEYVTIEPDIIKEVIFGCNLADSKVQNAISDLKNSHLDFSKLVIKRMEIDENNFRLKQKVIKPSA